MMKNIQMFMISVSGTAVKLKMDKTRSNEIEDTSSSVSSDIVNIEMFKINWNNRDKTITPHKSRVKLYHGQ